MSRAILGILLLLFAISPVFATVSDTTRKVREAGNGAKTAFDFDFKIFNDTDLTVYKINTAVSPEVLTLQTLNVDYTVSINTITEGGTVTYTVAPSATEASFIVRELSTDQSTDIPSEGVFPEKAIENALDKLAMNIIELEEESGRVAKLPINSTVTDLVYPDPEVGKVLFWETPTTLGNTSLVRVDSGTIEDRAIITSKLDDLAVTTPKIANKAITQAKIAADAVTFTEIAEDGAFGPFTGSWEFDSINIDGGSIDAVTIGAASAPTVTNLGAVATADINGGTMDGVAIGASSASTGKFTTITGNSLALTETTAPTTAASEGALYTKDTSGQPELFFREESSGDEVQITSGGSLVNSSSPTVVAGTDFIIGRSLTERSAPMGDSGSSVLTKLKGFAEPIWFNGTVHIACEGRIFATASWRMAVFINGSQVAARDAGGTSYLGITFNNIPVKVGDILDIRMRNISGGGGQTVYARNLYMRMQGFFSQESGF